MFGRALVLPESPVVSAARGGGLGVSAVRGTRVNVVVHMLKRESRSVVARRYRDADARLHEDARQTEDGMI